VTKILNNKFSGIRNSNFYNFSLIFLFFLDIFVFLEI